jgi:hypothetical protein
VQSERLAAKAKARGYRWLALEIDDFGNANNWPWFNEACVNAGIVPGTWVTDGANLGRWEPTASQFMIAEDEGFEDRQGIFNAIARGLPSKPKAIIGNGWWDSALGTEQLKPAVDAGFFYLTECYARTDLGAPTGYTPETLAWNAFTYLGFEYDHIQPVFGMFGGAGDSDYAEFKPGNPGWSDYAVEYVFVNA